MGNIDSLKGALQVVQGKLLQTNTPWLVGGSTGLLLQGVPLQADPRDLDVYADDTAARQIHEALAEYAIDKQAEDRSGMYRSILSHYLIDGVKVELVGGFEVSAMGCTYKVEAAYLLEHYAAYPLVLAGAEGGLQDLPLMPLEHELVFNVLRNRPDRYELIARVMHAREPVATPALVDLLSRNNCTDAFEQRVRELISRTKDDGE